MEFNDELSSNAKFIYSKYLAIRKHFEDDYDCWKYNLKVNSRFLNGFEKKRDFYICVGLYNKYKKIESIEKLLVLNLVKNNKCWLGALNHNLLKEYETFLQSSEYLFLQQIKPIFKDQNYNKKFNTSSEYPYSYIFNLYEKKLVNLETLIILNKMTGFLDLAYEKNKSDFIFEPEYKNIKKYQKFLEKWEDFDILRYKKIIKGLLSSLNNN